MRRRKFLRLLATGSAATTLSRSLGRARPGHTVNQVALPPKQVNQFSTETVLNTRRSYHSGFGQPLSDQVLANVLWATAGSPLIGTGRTIYVALPDNLYRYDPFRHELVFHLSGNRMYKSWHGFEIGVSCDVAEDAGASQLYGHLAVTSFWNSTANQPVCCTMEYATWHANDDWEAGELTMVNVYGLKETVSGMTSTLVANSSDESLPSPDTSGSVLFENALAHLNFGTQFDSTELGLGQLAQLVWASYGVTDHINTNNHAGLTVGSARGTYRLTGRIYMVRSAGVDRYHVRLPAGDRTTRDHRIERVTDGDRRPQLRNAAGRIPESAPDYFVYCAGNLDRIESVEAGFAGAAALLQATSSGLRGHMAADFSSAERSAIIDALGIPSDDLPLLVFSAGRPSTTGGVMTVQ